MKENIIKKIERIVAKKEQTNEESICYLLVLIRKLLEMQLQNVESFLTLHLFCDWAMHIKITKSNTGLRILAKINDTLVKNKLATDHLEAEMSQAIGFSTLRSELKLFFHNYSINDIIATDNNTWAVFVYNLMEIIRDVPLSFPKLSTLDKTKQKIYNQIAQNPIKHGAGVVSIVLSQMDYDAIGAHGVGKRVCLCIRTEDTTTIIIPLLIDASV